LDTLKDQPGRFALEWILPLEPGLATHVAIYDAERHPHHVLAVGDGADEPETPLTSGRR
jgi:hypothetical protein